MVINRSEVHVDDRALLFRCKESNGSGYTGGTLIELVGYGLSERGDRTMVKGEPEYGWWWIWGRDVHYDEHSLECDFYYFRESCLEPLTSAARRVLRELAAANRELGHGE